MWGREAYEMGLTLERACQDIRDCGCPEYLIPQVATVDGKEMIMMMMRGSKQSKYVDTYERGVTLTYERVCGQLRDHWTWTLTAPTYRVGCARSGGADTVAEAMSLGQRTLRGYGIDPSARPLTSRWS